MRFVDTNILLYAISNEPREATKTAVALALLNATDLALSVQVLQEFYVQATRLTKPDRITHAQALALIESWLRFSVQETTVEILRAALATSQRFRLSYWDVAILEAARAMDCAEVLSEDLSAGQVYDGVRVRNPFQTQRRRPRPRH